MSIIDQLDELTEEDLMTPLGREQREKVRPYLDAIKKAFHVEFVDDFLSAATEAQEKYLYESFERGFRMGAGLVMEVMSGGGEKTG